MPTRRTRASDARCGTTTRASARWWSSSRKPRRGRSRRRSHARVDRPRARGETARARVCRSRVDRGRGAHRARRTRCRSVAGFRVVIGRMGDSERRAIRNEDARASSTRDDDATTTRGSSSDMDVKKMKVQVRAFVSRSRARARTRRDEDRMNECCLLYTSPSPRDA